MIVRRCDDDRLRAIGRQVRSRGPHGSPATTASNSTTCKSRSSRRRARGIYCGAKPGDHFELQGRDAASAAGTGLLDLLAGRRCCRCSPAKQRPTASQRLDVDATPRSPAPIPTARPASASPGWASAASRHRRDDRGAVDERIPDRERRRDVRAARRATGSPASSAAAGSSPAAMAQVDRARGGGRSVRPSSTRASPPSTAPTSIPASRI